MYGKPCGLLTTHFFLCLGPEIACLYGLGSHIAFSQGRERGYTEQSGGNHEITLSSNDGRMKQLIQKLVIQIGNNPAKFLIQNLVLQTLSRISNGK